MKGWPPATPPLRIALVITVGLTLAIPTGAALRCGGGDSDWFNLCPAFVLGPAFLTLRIAEIPVPLFALLGPITFFIWSHQLLRGEAQIPRRSRRGLVALTVLTVANFALSWRCMEPEFWGPRFMWRPLALNVGALLFLWGLLLVHRRAPFLSSLLFHWAGVAWLVWCAFPGLPPFCTSGTI